MNSSQIQIEGVPSAVEQLSTLDREFITLAKLNLKVMSRTRSGISDTSSSAEKPKLSSEGADLAARAESNFENALLFALSQKNRTFENGAEVRAFVTEIVERVSEGLLAAGQSIWRTWETKYNQTKPENIQAELDVFFDILAHRLCDPFASPISTAGLIEKRFDGEIHAAADGCGRTAKVLSTFVFARSVGMPIFTDRAEYYRKIIGTQTDFDRYLASLMTPLGLDVKQTLDARLQTLIPDNSLSTHTPPSGLSSDQTLRQKGENYLEMLTLANQFTGDSYRLLNRTAMISFDCHFNQFRNGCDGTSVHYSDHLLKVAQRVDSAFDEFKHSYPEIRSISGEVLAPKAIAICVALLHDAVEDFYVNFRKSESPLQEGEGRDLAIRYLQRELGKIVGDAAACEIVELVKKLSIENDKEFPDAKYLSAVRSSPYTLQVKLADIDHNGTTFPNFSPAYPILIFPAQYPELVAGTRYEASMKQNIMSNLDVFRADESASYCGGRETVDYVLANFVEFGETEAVERVGKYFQNLVPEINAGNHDDFLRKNQISKPHLCAQIELLNKILIEKV